MPSTDRHLELREWATQPFKQERASRNVVSEQARAPSAVGEPHTLISFAAAPLPRGTISFRTAGARSSQKASATKASVEPG
jgi:hypothetical protein